MSTLTLRGVRKSYENSVEVIRGIDLDIADGEFAVFVGPSGCGKSTLLRMIAGLEDIDQGEIRIGGDLINEVPPADRGVAMVFQSYALYPHMTVAENMGFALKLAGQSKDEVKKAVGRAAEILQITHLLERKPKALSGGQRQRVAIGRAIVRKPRVFLFDEPLSNLDASLRVQMRIELSKLHKEIGNTMIYVTHDQVEAMTLGDRIAVFNAGRIEQVGTPMSLYEHPANQFVAGFLGSPRMNFIPCVAAAAGSGAVQLRVEQAGTLSLPGGLPSGASAQLVLGIRPEHLGIGRVENGLAARVDLLEHLGDSIIVHATLRGTANTVSLRVSADHEGLGAGQDIGLVPQASRALLFNDNGAALALH
ncbi:ABC transporter ATP-binding protein [Rhizobacter sp. OV335]|uniref:ABC transporter ATP-binding protein n=1 Tax=Rhizobacter sp. OV335 TaxID=1500264 RepID=UPI00092389B1|nr:sn-glycerol-3-phosphate ABC transporter ATP-binding protein UgpC [Rhizobacter sp. OV335]SHN00001.1 multiple sugar transport system ATP-binding protein [Rhizobacter sp. OV335]